MNDILILEASVLADKINLARFEGVIPSDEDTIRLCEIMDILRNGEGI
jgi:hypothetical protein